jgi:lysophospholipase L1-like esterase
MKWKPLLLMLALSAGACELALRLQQWLGPLYDLQMAGNGLELSPTLNHRPPPGTHRFVIAKTRYSVTHDENGLRSPLPRAGTPAKRVLFLGDSFVEGYDDEHTLPSEVGALVPLAMLNAGHSSYSPSILIVQARKLLPLLRPDFVVLVIDETDLADDWFRYRPLTVRDATGATVAVRESPAGVEVAEGYARAARPPLYLLRFARKLWHQRVGIPHIRARHPDPPLFELSGLPADEARRRFAEPIDYFAARLDELCRTLEIGVARERILIARHPHLEHLQGKWNRVIGETVARVAAAHRIRMLDAEDALAREFGDHPERFYWPNDMHFNFDGMARYAHLIAGELARLVSGG